MNRQELLDQLITKSHQILDKKGTKSRRLNGKIGHSLDYLEFEDSFVILRKDPNSKELEITKKDNNNPVLCCDETGKIYRTNGELRYVQDWILNIQL